MIDRSLKRTSWSINNQMKLNNKEVPTSEMIEIATNVALEKKKHWQDDNAITRGANKIRLNSRN